ncbi:MAG: hypothetical protein JNL61_05175 [Rhizobiaceae bacterium]|nr:hypothetical protein [Rhizobiaceae bacterium]
MTARQNFASLLDDLMRQHVEDEAEVPASVSFDYLAVADELCSGRIKVAPDFVAQEYRAADGYRDASAILEAELDALAAASALELPSIEPEDIARELDIRAATDADQLARLRRAFAFGNHPDRVPDHLRARAMVRMQVANHLIDEARRKLVERLRK